MCDLCRAPTLNQCISFHTQNRNALSQNRHCMHPHEKHRKQKRPHFKTSTEATKRNMHACKCQEPTLCSWHWMWKLMEPLNLLSHSSHIFCVESSSALESKHTQTKLWGEEHTCTCIETALLQAVFILLGNVHSLHSIKGGLTCTWWNGKLEWFALF